MKILALIAALIAFPTLANTPTEHKEQIEALEVLIEKADERIKVLTELVEKQK
ncbi:hypothetical protein M2G70_07350 [Vibrio vulnificus]|nr:hypothetical protein [Vibrio vulnificus]